MAADYRASYYADGADVRILAWAARHTAEWTTVLEQILRLRPGVASLLDIGAGSGGFLGVVHAACPTARLAAIETSAEARASLHARCPWLEFPVDGAERLHELPEQFDVVTILQTLEHLPDPLAACRGAWASLRAGGLLFVTVPNRRAAFVQLRGRRADCYANRTHLHFFDRGSVQRLLVNAGFGRIRRLVAFGGGRQRGWWSAVPQYCARLLGVSSELRVVAWKR